MLLNISRSGSPMWMYNFKSVPSKHIIILNKSFLFLTLFTYLLDLNIILDSCTFIFGLLRSMQNIHFNLCSLTFVHFRLYTSEIFVFYYYTFKKPLFSSLVFIFNMIGYGHKFVLNCFHCA